MADTASKGAASEVAAVAEEEVVVAEDLEAATINSLVIFSIITSLIWNFRAALNRSTTSCQPTVVIASSSVVFPTQCVKRTFQCSSLPLVK